jgi:hypothetical protein
MTRSPLPSWLGELQARFGAALCTPLERGSGTLRARPAAYDPRLAREIVPSTRHSALERVATYNRQYWYRLLSVMHGAFPLTTRLFGHFHFNAYAAEFLLARPPHGWDIDRVPDGFEDDLAGLLENPSSRLRESQPTVEAAALLQAARIDAAFRRVFQAPAEPVYRPTPDAAEQLEHARLRPSLAAAIVAEDWPLCRLRRELLGDRDETAVALPPRLVRTQHWALIRTPQRLGQLPLEPEEARLLNLLGNHSVADALGRLESECEPVRRAALPARAQAWLARSVDLGLWSGVDYAESG